MMYHWLLGGADVACPTNRVKTSLLMPVPNHGSDTKAELMSTAGVGGLFGAASPASWETSTPGIGSPGIEHGLGGGLNPPGTWSSRQAAPVPAAFTARTW